MKKTFLLILIMNTSWANSDNFMSLFNKALTKDPLIQQEKLSLLEIKYQIKKAKAEYYPKIKAIIGKEKRIAPKERSIELQKTVSELRLDYNLYQFGADQKKIQALEQKIHYKKQLIKYAQDELKRKLEKAYLKAITHKKHLDLIKKELRYNQYMAKQVAKKEHQGLVGKSDAMEIQMRQATFDNTLLKINQDYQHALNQIRKLAFIPTHQKVKLDDDISHRQLKVSKKELLKASQLKNMNLSNLHSQILTSEHELNASFLKRMPTLKLKARYGNMKIDDTYTTNNTQEGLVGVYLEIPLFDAGKEKAQEDIKEIHHKKIQLKLKKAEHNLEIDIIYNYEKLQNAHKLYELAQINLANAQRYFKKVLAEYQRGIKSSLDLVSARDRLYQFELNLIKYNEDYQSLKIKLEQLSGLTF